MLWEKIQRGHCVFSVFLQKDVLPRDLQEMAGLTSVTVGDHQTAMKPRKYAKPKQSKSFFSYGKAEDRRMALAQSSNMMVEILEQLQAACVTREHIEKQGLLCFNPLHAHNPSTWESESCGSL